MTTIPVERELHLRVLGMLSSYVTTLAGIDFPDNDEGDYHQRLNETKRAAVNSTIAELRALLSEQPQAGAGQAQIAECTNEDSWNCKYCHKTETCAALKDERNFGAPPKVARQEPLYITHRPLIRNAISLLSMRRPMAPDVERVVAELSAMLDGLPTPADAASATWMQVAELAETPAARQEQGDEVRIGALESWAESGCVDLGIEIDGGVYLTVSLIGDEPIVLREKNSVREAIDAALTNSHQGAKE